MEDLDLKKIKELQKIETEWTDKLETEKKKEEEILELTKAITDMLYANNNRAKVAVFGKRFDIGLLIHPKKSECILVVTDLARFELTKHKYKPTQIRCEFDLNFPAKDNIFTAVYTWIRHLVGMPIVEVQSVKNKEIKFERREK